MFACIFIPDFTVEAVLRAEPMLRGRPVAVLEGKPPLSYVVGATEAARRLGVEIGMTKLLAETLKSTEEPKIGRTEGQLKNRRSGEPKNKTAENNNEGQNFTPNCFPHDNEREERTRRPHAQGTYEATYGRMNTRFGLYRTKIDADELNENCEEVESREEEVVTKNEERRTKDGELILRNRSAAAESSAHAALLDAAHAVSPRVEDSAVDTVVLDISGLDRLFGTSQ